ncbi:TPA: hypothetical protein N0F65_009247, partial [Lagenidium giganteum]
DTISRSEIPLGQDSKKPRKSRKKKFVVREAFVSIGHRRCFLSHIRRRIEVKTLRRSTTPLPSFVVTGEGDRVLGVEALAICCRRLAEPVRWSSREGEFFRMEVSLTRIFSTTIKLLFLLHKRRLYFHSALLRRRLQAYTEAIRLAEHRWRTASVFLIGPDTISRDQRHDPLWAKRCSDHIRMVRVVFIALFGRQWRFQTAFVLVCMAPSRDEVTTPHCWSRASCFASWRPGDASTAVLALPKRAMLVVLCNRGSVRATTERRQRERDLYSLIYVREEVHRICARNRRPCYAYRPCTSCPGCTMSTAMRPGLEDWERSVRCAPLDEASRVVRRLDDVL